jgi:hypothetical protein
MVIDRVTILKICDVSMKQKFRECDTILRKLKTKSARNHVLNMLGEYEKIIAHDDKLQCYIVKGRYMVYYSKKLKNFKYSCQCTWRSYYTSICSHVAVIKIHNILTFGKDLIQEYLIYIAKKEIYRRLLRNRTPKFLSKC